MTEELLLAISNFEITPRKLKSIIMTGFESSFFANTYEQKRKYIQQCFTFYSRLVNATPLATDDLDTTGDKNLNYQLNMETINQSVTKVPMLKKEREPKTDKANNFEPNTQLEPYPGQIVDARYQITDLIHRGVESTIFLARDKKKLFGNKDRVLVIKWFKSNLLDRSTKWQKSHKIIKGSANIEGICRIFEVVTTKSSRKHTYVALEYLEGITLGEHISNFSHKPKKNEIRTILSNYLQVVGALVLMHEKANIVHRDIKPSNIMKLDDGRFVIIDVGLVKNRRDEVSLTISSQALGSPPYMAPEAFEISEALNFDKCDVYSVGATLYELLTTIRPFSGFDMQIYRDKSSYHNYQAAFVKPERHNPEISHSLSSIIMKTLEYYPVNRYPSMKTLYQDLEAWLNRKKFSVNKTSDSKVLVFINYVSEDTNLVNDFVTKLEAKGVNVWFAKTEVKYGDDFQGKIEEAFKRTKFVLACCTKAYFNKNGWQKDEVRWATISEKEKRTTMLIPIKLNTCKVEGLLQIKVNCDLSSPVTYETNFKRLLEQINS